eukprot:COSAG01_NODE_9381_length_2462_cov_1.555226_1_plen_134_part_00
MQQQQQLLLQQLLLLAAARAAQAHAQNTTFSLHRAFSPSMVLQAEAPTVFGSGKPGSSVRVSISSASTVATTVATTVLPDGSWLARLPPQPASDPSGPGVTIKVDGGCAGCIRTLPGILMGDVWVCGGQSNSE